MLVFRPLNENATAKFVWQIAHRLEKGISIQDNDPDLITQQTNPVGWFRSLISIPGCLSRESQQIVRAKTFSSKAREVTDYISM